LWKGGEKTLRCKMSLSFIRNTFVICSTCLWWLYLLLALAGNKLSGVKKAKIQSFINNAIMLTYFRTMAGIFIFPPPPFSPFTNSLIFADERNKLFYNSLKPICLCVCCSCCAICFMNSKWEREKFFFFLLYVCVCIAHFHSCMSFFVHEKLIPNNLIFAHC
jgi:hypothetical protein